MNDIYNKLVKEKEDVVGLLAYGIYKQHKIDFITSFKKQNGDREPSPSELKTYITTTSCDTQLSLFLEKAESIFMNISENISTEAQISFKNSVGDDVFNKIGNIDIKINNIDNKINSIDSRKENGFKTFLYGSLQSLLGSIFFVLFVGIVYFFVNSLDKNPNEIYKQTSSQSDTNQEKK